MITKELLHSCEHISALFDQMDGVQASSWQYHKVHKFKEDHPELISDLNFCFEVLAGKHKLGFTLPVISSPSYHHLYNQATSIKNLHKTLAEYTADDKSEVMIYACASSLPILYRTFLARLFNREYRLGYSNRKAMVTSLHCMLAKKYPDDLPSYPKQYYIQEKLNGNRCIAWFDEDMEQWRFTSRSQKEKEYPFDMSVLDPAYIYDGEVMSRNAMGNRDFAKTSGLANSKYSDKSELVYIIYDILDDELTYESRWQILSSFLHTIPNYQQETRFEFDSANLSHNVAILPILAKVTVYSNISYNHRLDAILDFITEQGGEGVMLRDPEAPYYHSSGAGDRKNYLLKYKKLKTCDLRITGWNEGKGKYEGMIGSFICEDDQHTIKVNVAGIDDDTRASDPTLWIGKIIEIAYFDSSQAKNKSISSLQFPRFKRVRVDKTETSLY